MAANQNYDGSQNPDLNRQQAPEVYKFTAEEVLVLRQCNVESFYQRSLPIATLLGVGSYLGVQSGYLKGHPRFGASPKVTIAVIAGYFIGKLSYQQKCAEKLMALPNSRIGEMLRQRKKQGYNESLTLDPAFSTTTMPTESSLPTLPQQSHLDIDTERPYVSQYEHPLQEDSSYDVSEIPVPPGGAISTSYDELRRRNREEHDSQRGRAVRPPAADLDAAAQPVIRARTPPREAQSMKPKNKYGDDWEM